MRRCSELSRGDIRVYSSIFVRGYSALLWGDTKCTFMNFKKGLCITGIHWILIGGYHVPGGDLCTFTRVCSAIFARGYSALLWGDSDTMHFHEWDALLFYEVIKTNFWKGIRYTFYAEDSIPKVLKLQYSIVPLRWNARLKIQLEWTGSTKQRPHV